MDAVIQKLNQLMNVIDPPKDLNVGEAASTLKEDRYSKVLKRAIQELFGDLPSNYIVVGDAKSKIIDSVQRQYDLYFKENKNQLNIVREKHSSGHDARPEGLYLAQDNGSLDIISNPKLIITPGSILDPAGKTKKGAENLIDTGSDTYNILPQTYIESLSMEKAVSGPIVFNRETYTVEIPTPMGTIKASFDKETFKPTQGDIDYFMGNDTKNKAIVKLIKQSKNDDEIIEEVKKYILVKELGDTLQVQWLNHIFKNQLLIQRTNTVVGTTDTVVCYRSIVNKVGVIWTNNGKTTYFLPYFTDKTAQAAIEKSFIMTIQNEVISHNKSVIDVLEAVINEPKDDSRWVDGLTWTDTQVSNAKDYLRKQIQSLNEINADLKRTLETILNVDGAKSIAEKSHFKSPFIWYNVGNYFKCIKSVKKIYQNDFIVFTPSTFTNQRGGRRGSATKSKTRSVKGHSRVKGEFSPIEYDTSILTTNQLNDTYFLYCYVRDYHPEIFTYAFILKEAINRRKPSWYEMICGRTPSKYPLVKYDLIEKYKVSYYINDNPKAENRFILTEYPASSADDAYSATRTSVQLAELFLRSFPSLYSPQLYGFMSHIRSVHARSFPKIDALTSEDIDSLKLNQVGGEAIVTPTEIESILSEAMDSYEVYYSLRIKAAYQDKDLKKEDLIKGLTSSVRKVSSKTRKLSPPKTKKMNSKQKTKRVTRKRFTHTAVVMP